MQFTEDQETDILEQATNYICEKNAQGHKLTLEDETVIYICEIIATMGTANHPQEIYKLLSSKTKAAFTEIGAHEYAEVFGTTYNSAKEEIDNLKGIFKGSRKKKILNRHAVALYEATSILEQSTSLVSTYLIPYIIKKFKDHISIKNN